MPVKRALPGVLLFIGFLALFALIAYREQVKEFLSFNLRKAKIHTDNFSYESGSNPRRHRPLSTLEKETELALYVGEPFRSFGKKDWQEFWGLVYDAHPLDRTEQPGLPQRVRQMEPDEIAGELTQRYPQPFAYFSQENWRIFFSIAFSKNES